jgi:type II secretory pathway pseudopilin PulG
MFKATLNNFAFSILEVIVAIFIITLGMVGVSSLVVQNIRAQYIDKNVLTASGLAQEGLELVRNVRDLNWLTSGNAWTQNLLDTYSIDYRGSINQAVDSINDVGAKLYVNGAGFYTHAAAGNTPTGFYRLITASNEFGYLDVKCLVRWKQGNKNHDYTAETYLYNWR